MLLVVSGVQAWRRFLILVLVGATMQLVVSGVQAWRCFFNFGTCRSNNVVVGLRSASLSLIFNIGTCKSNGNLQMCRVHIAVISIGSMVSFEILRAFTQAYTMRQLWGSYACQIMVLAAGKCAAAAPSMLIRS